MSSTVFDSPENLEILQDKIKETDPCICIDDDTLRRVLRADKGRVGAAHKRVLGTMKWREANICSPLVCPACKEDPRSHYLHPIGYDKLGRPIIYTVFALAKNNITKNHVQHMVHTFEHAIQIMPPGVERWTWIADFSGFGLTHCNPTVALAANNLFSVHYPERLGLFVLLGAPKIFQTLYNVVDKVLDPDTKERLKVVDKKKMRESLEDVFSEETLHWLETEVAENTTATYKTKTYDFSATQRSLQDAVKAQEKTPTHNVLGVPSFVKVLSNQSDKWLDTYLHRA